MFLTYGHEKLNNAILFTEKIWMDSKIFEEWFQPGFCAFSSKVYAQELEKESFFTAR